MTRRSHATQARADEFAYRIESYEPQPGVQDVPLPPIMAVWLAAWRTRSTLASRVETRRRAFCPT